MKLQVDTSNSFCVMLWTKYKYEKLQRAITPKLYKRELSFFNIALCNTKNYLPMKFQVDVSYIFVLCSGQNISVQINEGS